MALFRKCLAVINTRSGAREGRSVFASALQKYLDQAGILHTDVLVPERDVRHALTTHLPSSDCLIICGGDGTISSVVNVLASAVAAEDEGSTAGPAPPPAALFEKARAMLSKPIAVVPTGLQNSIAHSLGVSSAERAVSQFVMGRADAVPVWAVRLDGRPLRYICAYAAVGTYANVVARFHRLERVGEDFVALPSLGRHQFTAAALYSTVGRVEQTPCRAALFASPHSSRESSREEGLPGLAAGGQPTIPLARHYPGPLRMVLAAQMPLQHGGYSLTPRATYKQGRLAVTVATCEASRLRMWHLLRREAVEGDVLEEDGVATHLGVEKLALTFDVGIDEDTPRDALLLLDGEEVHVPLGATVTIEKMANCALPFLIC